MQCRLDVTKVPGSGRVRVRGALAVRDAERLVHVICASGLGRVAVSFAQSSGDLDVVLPRVVEALALRHDAPEVTLEGLTRHQLRLLDYLGLGQGPSARGLG